MDRYSIDYWNKIKVGSIIQLDDQQTLEFLLAEGLTVSSNGADFEVVRVKDISLNDDSVQMKIVYLEFKDILWYLVVLNTGGEISLKIYYQPDDFIFGNRKDMLENECFYLFEAPEDEDNVIPEDLIFSTKIEDEEIEYKSFYGVMYGTSVEEGKEDFATVVELSTKEDCEDTDLLIIELCNVAIENQPEEYEDSEPIVDIDSSNSFIMYLKGCSVEMNDVEILT